MRDAMGDERRGDPERRDEIWDKMVDVVEEWPDGMDNEIRKSEMAWTEDMSCERVFFDRFVSGTVYASPLR